MSAVDAAAYAPGGPLAPPPPPQRAAPGHPMAQPHLPPMSSEDRQTLSRLLRRPQLNRFWKEVQDQAAQDLTDASVTLTDPSESERLAIAGVFGLTVGDGALHLDLKDLDASLRASRFAISLSEALELVAEGQQAQQSAAHRSAVRQAAVQAAATVQSTTSSAPQSRVQPVPKATPSQWHQEASAHFVIEQRPVLIEWLRSLEEDALPQTLAPGQESQLLRSVLEVVASLPSLGESLQTMAFRLLGDHHALDVGRPAGELVLRALSVLSRRPAAATRSERHALWQWAGVECDDISSDVLTLGLRPTSNTTFSRALDSMSKQGEPMRLTLRQIRSNDLKLEEGTRVFVCQHAVVAAAAAERYPNGSRPLVVTNDRPGPAVQALLKALLVGGAKLSYHGDFDWQGLRIANDLYRSFPFQPWRYRGIDYSEECTKQALAPDLIGHPVYARWDDSLADAMAQGGKAIEEERVLPALLRDLNL